MAIFEPLAEKKSLQLKSIDLVMYDAMSIWNLRNFNVIAFFFCSFQQQQAVKATNKTKCETQSRQ